MSPSPKYIGIVGAEGAKFTPKGEVAARELIYQSLTNAMADGAKLVVVSGGCHLGGIDIWAADIARNRGIEVIEYLPKVLEWSEGYRPRNIQIARRSDVLHNITVNATPPDYEGLFFKVCYHCNAIPSMPYHVKSGGCWTANYAERLGKPARRYVVNNTTGEVVSV